MVRRTVTAILWLFAIWTTVGAVAVYAGLPSIVAPALGLVVAALVWWDPRGWLWMPVPNAAVRRRLASLDRVPDSPASGEIRPEAESVQG
jgi:hypothetical protein